MTKSNAIVLAAVVLAGCATAPDNSLLQQKTNENLQAYYGCMRYQGAAMSAPDIAPQDSAIAAHGNCSKSFGAVSNNLIDLFQGSVRSPELKLRAQQEALQEIANVKRNGIDIAVSASVKSRLR